MEQILNNLFFLFTALLQILILLGVFYLLFPKTIKLSFLKKLFKFTSDYFLKIAFLLTLGATTGSLLYSELIGFDPCNLCWLQRIFMYSLTLLLGLSVAKKERKFSIDVVILFSSVGGVISLYHYIVQVLSLESVVCSVGSVSCSSIFVMGFGYITIPMMTLTIFLFLLVYGIIAKKVR